MKYLISPQARQCKANLHCHSTLSDGAYTPEQMKKLYKDNGYSILAITDHERPYCHQNLSDPDFLMLTGYEGYIRTNPEYRYELYEAEIHMNLFARDPYNTTYICYDPPGAKYQRRDNALHELENRAGREGSREYSPAFVNEYVRTAKENGYIVAYNHPYWSLEEEKDILAYEGFFSMEICNYGSYVMNGLEYNGALYDKMLRAGKHIFCHGSDDSHNHIPPENPCGDALGGYTMIMPEEFTYDGVFRAMEAGEMYSSMGPRFTEVSVENGRIHIECSEVAHMHVYFGSKRPQFMHAAPGESLTSWDFDIDPKALYVRVSIRDREGRWADTRGYSREEVGLPSL